MGKALQIFKHRAFYAVVLSVVMSLALVAVMVYGATTISTNINTGGSLTVSGTSALTGAVTFSSVAILQNSTTNPSSTSEGSVYYNTSDKVLRMYNGSGWVAVASSTDATGGLIIGATNGVRFNTVASGYMALGTGILPVDVSKTSYSALLSLIATSTATTPLSIIAKLGQTGLLIDVMDSASSTIFSVNNSGGASTTVLSTTRRAADALVVSGYATTSGSTGNFATEGNITAVGDLSVTGTTALTGAVTLTGALTVNGNTTLGNAVGDTVQAIAGTFSIGGIATTTAVVQGGISSATSTIGSVQGSFLGVGTTTPSQELSVAGDGYFSSSGTTTIHIKSTTANSGGCIEMNAQVQGANKVFRLFIDSTGVASTSLGSCGGTGPGL